MWQLILPFLCAKYSQSVQIEMVHMNRQSTMEMTKALLAMGSKLSDEGTHLTNGNVELNPLKPSGNYAYHLLLQFVSLNFTAESMYGFHIIL